MNNTLSILSALACTAGSVVFAQQTPAPEPADEPAAASVHVGPPAATSAPVGAAVAASPAATEAAPAPAASTTAPPTAASTPAAEPASPTAPSCKVGCAGPDTPPAEMKVQQTLQKIVDEHAADGISSVMAEVNKAFPDATGVSVGESTEIVDGRGTRTVTVTIADKDGKSTTYSLINPVENAETASQLLFDEDVFAKPGKRPGKAQGARHGGFRDGMAESMLSRAEAICDLLAGVRDKATADAAAAPLEKQCLDLENMLAASRNRRLPRQYVGRLIRKYNDAMENRIDRMEKLISEMAAKDYYGSSAMKETAEKFCR